MADFSWLNEIPESEWSRLRHGFSRAFDLAWFLEKSDAALHQGWIYDFDEWGKTQSRGYQQHAAPDINGKPVAFIVFGDEQASDAAA